MDEEVKWSPIFCLTGLIDPKLAIIQFSSLIRDTCPPDYGVVAIVTADDHPAEFGPVNDPLGMKCRLKFKPLK